MVQSESHYSTLWADDLSCPDSHLGASDAGAADDADDDDGSADVDSSAAFAGVLASAGPAGADVNATSCSGAPRLFLRAEQTPQLCAGRAGAPLDLFYFDQMAERDAPVRPQPFAAASAFGAPRLSAAERVAPPCQIEPWFRWPLRKPNTGAPHAQTAPWGRCRVGGRERRGREGWRRAGRRAAAPAVARVRAAPLRAPAALAATFLCARDWTRQVRAPRERAAHALAGCARRLERQRGHPLSASRESRGATPVSARLCNPARRTATPTARATEHSMRGLRASGTAHPRPPPPHDR